MGHVQMANKCVFCGQKNFHFSFHFHFIFPFHYKQETILGSNK